MHLLIQLYMFARKARRQKVSQRILFNYFFVFPACARQVAAFAEVAVSSWQYFYHLKLLYIIVNTLLTLLITILNSFYF